jgi:hypothetical protein
VGDVLGVFGEIFGAFGEFRCDDFGRRRMRSRFVEGLADKESLLDLIGFPIEGKGSFD